MTDWYKIKKKYVWTQQVRPNSWLKLELKLDFSVDTTFKDYTYWYTSWSWLQIDTSNGWVTSAWSSYWNGSVYKTISWWAKKVWTRVQFNFLNTSTSSTRWGWICLYPFNSSLAYWCNIDAQNTRNLCVIEADVVKSQVNPVFSLGTDYYLDFKFDNWVFDAILTDMNNNVVSSTTYTNTSVTSIPTVWFSMWNHASTAHFCRVKKYREAYEV